MARNCCQSKRLVSNAYKLNCDGKPMRIAMGIQMRMPTKKEKMEVIPKNPEKDP